MMKATVAEALSLAIALASEKHKAQFDKAGMPYILHPLRVMSFLKEDMELMTIGVLHDVVEDSDVTFEDLRMLGMTERVIKGVRAVTKMPGQTAEEYLAGIKANTDAIRVKLADLRHNMDARRLKGIGEKDRARMDEYCKMYYILKDLV
jgi:(p)ppGpp synthase/HD superfamily hydrolase